MTTLPAGAVLRIRMHGRGGQGIKTGGRVLGSAFFLSGFEVQDAPLYGAERRGAPIFAFVRAARDEIKERGVIRYPDLVVVADETLLQVALDAILEGAGARTVLLIRSRDPAETLVQRFRLPCRTVRLPAEQGRDQLGQWLGVTCAGAAARLAGVIDRATLEAAVIAELSDLGAQAIEASLARALWAYDYVAEDAGSVAVVPEGMRESPKISDWVEVPQDEIALAMPAIRAPRTSERVRTGLWRTLRPVVDTARCHRCTWICSTACPDGVITVGEGGLPGIDLEHCKGCMICALQCPWQAIETIPEAAQ